MNAEIEKIPTQQLVEELSRREGVTLTDVLPYQRRMFEVEGPAGVLVVID